MGWLEWLALPPLLFWGALLFRPSRRWPRTSRLSRPLPAPAVAGVVAVVPARNEADLLPRTLPSLLQQEGLRVVLVDDESTDGTAEAAARAAAAVGAADRLRVVAAGRRTPGWTGKLWALERGLAAARESAGPAEGPEWLLLTDADVLHRPGSAASLLARATDPHDPRDLVSVMARLTTETFWEKLLIPAFLFFFHLLYPFGRVADPRAPTAAAAGGCILVRTATLVAAGGFASVHDAVIDDVALARRLAGAGGRLWLGLDPGIRSVRPYRDLAGIWRVVERTAFVQLRHRLSWTVLAIGALLAVAVAPPFLVAAGAVAHLGPLGAAPLSPARAVIWAFLAWALQAAALAPWVRHQRLAASYSWALPFASLLYAGMTATSAWRGLTGRGAGWKGRLYRSAGRSKSR
ncbi:MAG: glycosyltransferase [Thermoanaerobaculia bacterium]|nr:glycosyltransferase [Thermoanaerobaculia bacterium]